MYKECVLSDLIEDAYSEFLKLHNSKEPIPLYLDKVLFKEYLIESDIHDDSLSEKLYEIFHKIIYKNSKEQDHPFAKNDPQSDAQITKAEIAPIKNVAEIYYHDTRQSIDGFGVFAGRGHIFYNDKNRDAMLCELFSPEGLNLSIIRAEVDHDYTSDKLDQEIDQYWVLKKAKARYGVDKIFASTWSPPADMKTIKGQIEGKGLNRLNPDYDDAFCAYLAQFCEDFTKAGIPLYAISPMNEPEYPTPNWAGTIWLPTDTARFIPKLKNTFLAKNIDTKIVIGECANWTLSDIYTSLCLLFLESKNKSDCLDICASHGYSLPAKSGKETYVTYNQKVNNWAFNRSSLPRWVTEACETKAFDPSMKKGLEFATSLHKFLTRGNVSAFTFWLAVANGSNECLFVTDGQAYQKGKIFDVYGNYTRYIRPGFQRVATSGDTSSNNILYSAFRDPEVENSLTVVAINNSDAEQDLTFTIKEADIKTLTPYLTTGDKDSAWIKKAALSVNETDKTFTLTMPPCSVVTLKNTAG